jgi:hypothetical protein
VNGGSWTVGNLGYNGTGAQNGGTYQITGGASVSITSPRFGGHGSYIVGGSGGAGILNFGSGLSSENGGAIGFVAKALTDGIVTFQGLTLGLPNASVTSANELTVQTGGQATITGTLTVGNTTTGKTETNTVNLNGGKLLVSGTIQANTATAGQTRVFNWTGGQLTAATLIASANFNAPAAGGISTTALEQTAGTLAPGDIGTAGRTVITGGYNQGTGGTLAIDVGGTTQAAAYQTGQYDYLPVSGTTSLAGSLTVKLINGFTPSNASIFTIVNSSGTLTGAFSNVAFGSRVTTTGGEGTFLVTQSGNSVRLSGYTAASALTPIETWRQTNFGTSANIGNAADSSDPDGDGVMNLMEYALDSLPNSSASRAVPILVTTANQLTLTFTRAHSDVTYIVEGSLDLTKWTPVATNPGTVGQSVTVTDTVVVTNASPCRRFLRLRITNP